MLRTPLTASKVHQEYETTKGRKDDTNPRAKQRLGVLIYTFPTPKRASKKSNNSMTSSCASSAFLRSRLESQSWNSFNSLPSKWLINAWDHTQIWLGDLHFVFSPVDIFLDLWALSCTGATWLSGSKFLLL